MNDPLSELNTSMTAWNEFILDVNNADLFTSKVVNFVRIKRPQQAPDTLIQLPISDKNSFRTLNIQELLGARKSTRIWSGQEIDVQKLSDLLFWGVYQNTKSHWAYSSAGGLYTIECYLVLKNVTTLTDGLYRYFPKDHALEPIKMFRKFSEQFKLLGLSVDIEPNFTFLLVSKFEEVDMKYSHRAARFIAIEAGQIFQNLQLLSEALGLNYCGNGRGHDLDIISAIGGHKDCHIFVGTLFAGMP